MSVARERWHAQDRALERYGADLSQADVLAISEQIKAAKSVLVRRSEPCSEWHMVRHGDRVMVAVCKRLKDNVIIATFLPADAIVKGSSKRHYGKRGGRR